MSSAVTDYGASYWAQVVFGIVVPPGGYWVALLNGEPGADVDGDVLADREPDDPSYGRTFIATGDASWDVNGGFLVSAVAVDFGLADTDWGDIDHFALCTDPSSGEVYAYGQLAEPTFIEAGDGPSLPAGSIVVALVNVESQIAV